MSVVIMLSENKAPATRNVWNDTVYYAKLFTKLEKWWIICINIDRDLLIWGDKNMGIYIYPLTFSD